MDVDQHAQACGDRGERCFGYIWEAGLVLSPLPADREIQRPAPQQQVSEGQAEA
jgi:hypothetical protein